jgi:NAD(P)-dependent dehydrogenase (short-subunit alcohol dehydrogenase family)
VQKALPLLNDGGSIILNGSVASAKGTAAFGVYAASKAAIRSFVRTWTTDLKDRRIRSNVVSPGPINTPLVSRQSADVIARIVSSVAHKSSKQEIGNLLGIVARDLKDSQAKDVSDDWRFAIAYNAALQAAGYRASRENHHSRVIQSLELTLGKDAKFICAFDAESLQRFIEAFRISFRTF